MQKTAFIWDLDGTLLDSYEAILSGIEETFAQFSIPYDKEKVREFILKYSVQDLLVWVTKGISAVTTRLREEGRAVADEVNHLVTENLFTTITNANFDKAAIEKRIEKTLEMKTALWEQLERRDNLPEAAGWTGEPSEFIKKASEAGVLIGQNEDIISLRSLITYGLKGLSAYTRHANVLLQEDREADAFLQRALAATLDDGLSVDDLIHLTLETGEYGVRGMALLDRANTETYGNPEITTVDIGVGSNPGILVSGHDLRDMEMLLEQTQGTGVDVYTLRDASGAVLSGI
mgnify:CR=1 FL=1